MGDLEPCPACGALPCDWVDNPHWRPIETAPKDREILLFVAETGEQFAAFWGTDPEDGDTQWVFARGQGISFIVRDPTHWLPLPTPPQRATTSGES